MTSKTRPADPSTATQAMTALLNVARWYGRQHERELAARIPDMTRARAAVLVYLAENEDCSKQVQLAEALDLRPESLVSVLDRLERLGWVERVDAAGDRRVRKVRLTKAARGMLPLIRAVDEAFQDAAIHEIGAQSLADLRGILDRIASNIAKRQASS
jgi:DNA-binding MarR family transcriptional regulator